MSEAYNWRWVFFMLTPFTIVALIGALAFIRDNKKGEDPRLDWSGFIALAIGITALQLMLDRGERAGWFEAWEILIYAGLSLSALWVFGVRNMTAARPFLNPVLLRDRNFVVGTLLIFIFGMLNFTPITLLPTMLQNVQGFPDSIIGQILSARGAGTFIGFAIMFLLAGVDPRIPMVFGLMLQAYGGWLMAGFGVNVSINQVLWATAIQGLGVGFVWIPLSVVTFATLPNALVPDGTSVFHLLRNMGSSIFISITVALVLRQTKVNYAGLAENVSPFNEVLRLPGAAEAWSLGNSAALPALGREIDRQATMIGYLDAFVMFTVMAAAAVPLVFLVRTRKPA